MLSDSPVLYILIMVFIFVLPDHEQAVYAPVFSILYRCGAWIIGAGLVFTCLWGKGKNGLVLGILMLVLYLSTAFFTMFGLMALTSEWELLWYIHPFLIIPCCICALHCRKKKQPCIS